ncbi:MAG: GDSL-type esterase/lipase family protein [Oscillospiraceae bacterium]|nr:GDSL-type esterase/lipase family protein [Oscillospiraceae bacterium]
MLDQFEKMPRSQQIMIGICAVCVVALIVTGIVMAVVLNSGDKDNQDGSSSVVVDVEGNYDQATFTLDPDKYPAVLKATDDAGETYIAETLFIGDSNIERAINYNIISLNNGIGVTSMGIQSVISKACVYFQGVDAPVAIPQAISMMQPRRVVLSFGTNNTVGYETDAFIALYQKVIDAIRTAYPNTDIIINAIPPVGQNRENQLIKIETIDAFNLALAQLAQKNSLSFVNTNEALRDASGYAKAEYVIEDGLHLTEAGLNAMFSYIRGHSHIVDDARGTVSDVPTPHCRAFRRQRKLYCST